MTRLRAANKHRQIANADDAASEAKQCQMNVDAALEALLSCKPAVEAAAHRAHPHIAARPRQQGAHVVVAQAARVFGVMPQMAHMRPIMDVQTAFRANPHLPGAILGDDARGDLR